MRTLLPVQQEAALILAPEAVQRSFDRTNRFLAWATGPLRLRPTERAIAESFWRTFAEEGGTEDDFKWMFDAGLCDENDHELWQSVVTA